MLRAFHRVPISNSTLGTLAYNYYNISDGYSALLNVFAAAIANVGYSVSFCKKNYYYY